MHTKLSVNSSKIKIMLVKSQKKDKPCAIMYNNEPLECVENFKYLGLEVPSIHRWNECATHCRGGFRPQGERFADRCEHGVHECIRTSPCELKQMYI
mgnify:CR=1 FL=1